MTERVHVRLVDGQALVETGERTLTVEQRSTPGRLATCPLELVAAALGS